MRASAFPGEDLASLPQPEDIAPSVLFLASDEASWITGQILGVNGGNLMI